MSTLVERLREAESWNSMAWSDCKQLFADARAEIERLTAELKIQDDANDILTRTCAAMKAERDAAHQEITRIYDDLKRGTPKYRGPGCCLAGKEQKWPGETWHA